MDKNTSEIAKLTERISKDPKSKLFVSLAEEYKRSGDIEMAIHVLTEGLKNNPGYVTARSILGKLLLDKGDFVAARRELEEVVKTVPENFLAQKKLGDLHVLLGSRTDALRYFKTAHALNPGDAETAALVADLEAGRDVKPSQSQQKAAPSSGPAVPPGQKPAPSQEAAGPEALSGADEETRPAVETEAPASPALSGVESAIAEAAQASPSEAALMETEVAEEVLVVEPIEEELALEKAPSFGTDFLSVTEDLEGSAVPASEEGISASPGPAMAGEGAEGLSDDFTTNTLAELYIAQGFHEKAIDIYERMLADHPDSKGLRDKLEQVRSQALSAGAPATEDIGTAAEAETDDRFLGEAREYIPPVAADAGGGSPEAGPQSASDARGGEELFAEPKEYSPPPETEEIIEAAEKEKTSDAGEIPPDGETAGAVAGTTFFEPKEYIPPTATLRRSGEEAPAAASGQPRAAARKEMIGRLESWLKNIKKEA